MRNRTTGSKSPVGKAHRLSMGSTVLCLVCSAFLTVAPEARAQQSRAEDSVVCGWLTPHLKALQSGRWDSTDNVQSTLRRAAAQNVTTADLRAVVPDTVLAGMVAAIKSGHVDSAKTLIRSALANSAHPKAKKIDAALDDVFALLGFMPDTVRAISAERMVTGKQIACTL